MASTDIQMFIELESQIQSITHVEHPQQVITPGLCLNPSNGRELFSLWSACSLFEYLCCNILQIGLEFLFL